MTASFSQLKSHFARWREWEPNPIVVKELRQAVRSWAVTGLLLLFLAVLFLASVVFLATQSFDGTPNLQLGASMFSAFVAILAGASVFFIPLYAGARVAAERHDNNPDLLYIATLSPTRIIWGKFLCGACVALLFFSACLPFMAFTNLLRGVDLPTVFFIIGFLFLTVCAANMIAIFLGCLPVSRPFKFLFVIYGMIQLMAVIVVILEASSEMMRSGVGAMMADSGFWMYTGTAAGVGISVIGLFFVLSVALISPPSANRAWPPRLYLTILWALGGLLGAGWARHESDPRLLLFWTFPVLAVMILALLTTVSNSDHLGPRVRRGIPPPGIRRALAFVFSNGAAGGLVWAGLVLAGTYYATFAAARLTPKPQPSFVEEMDWFRVTTLYAFDYALAALLIHRKFLPRRPPKLAGLLAVLLAGGWALAPSIALFFLNRLSWKSVEGLQLGNVFNYSSLRDEAQRLRHLHFALGWLAIMLALAAPWFFRQMWKFRPPEQSPPAAPG